MKLPFSRGSGDRRNGNREIGHWPDSLGGWFYFVAAASQAMGVSSALLLEGHSARPGRTAVHFLEWQAAF